jgi:ribosomal protein S18 acetylase RimI-like enzyme
MTPPESTPVNHTVSAKPSIYASTALAECEVVVRSLLETDLRPLEWQGGEDLRSFYEELWRNHQAGEIHVLVADFNGFPVGLANLHWPGKPTHPGVPDIQSLRVHPIFRGLKIGSLLLRVCEEIVRQAGFARIGLSVGLENPKAKKLYERHGYAVDGAPYCDVWYYTDSAGQGVRVEEHVEDLVKNLPQLAADPPQNSGH